MDFGWTENSLRNRNTVATGLDHQDWAKDTMEDA